MIYHVQFPGLGLEFTLDRVAFTVFGMPIYWYGILIATGLALAIVFAFSHARRFGIDSDRMVDVILIGTVCAVIGGRAFYVATAPFEYASFAEMLDIRLGGVAIYGAGHRGVPQRLFCLQVAQGSHSADVRSGGHGFSAGAGHRPLGKLCQH